MDTEADPKLAAKLHQWLSFRAFLDHTLRELEDGTLDHWFDDPLGLELPGPDQEILSDRGEP